MSSGEPPADQPTPESVAMVAGFLALMARGGSLADQDLRGLDLRCQDLSGKDLSGADMTGANLTGCVLAGANLTKANLSRHDLRNHDLSGCLLARATLTRTNLSGQDLRYRYPILEDEDEDAPDEDDPLGLQQADADIRAQKRREESAAVTGGEESGDWQRPVDKLQSAQIPLLPPAELTDETLTAQLWQLLHNLYCTGFYVLHSDHLSDAELYAELWRRGLRDEALLPGKCRNGGWFHDFVGSGSDEHQAIFLRYHATDEQRERHLRDWPDDPLPPKTPRPFNRDWRLPKGPF